jgi:FKBP-type peptidyl-prolyl cis-trans isomerase
MEKTILKGKKEIRTLLADSLHEAIKTLGVAKAPRKFEKTLEKTSKKLASQVARQMKKEIKKMQKATAKLSKKSKKITRPEAVAA